MNKTDADVIVIGSGHNGLIAAAYLARAGHKVLVLERRDNIGGAVCTETMFKSERFPKGFRMDVGSSAHIMIRQTGIIEELGLTEYGLEYIEMDPFMSYPAPDGKGVIHFYRDLDKTIESIGRISKADAQNYRDFVEFWGRVNRGVLNVFQLPPQGQHLTGELFRGAIRGGGPFRKGETTEGLQRIMSSYGKIIHDRFDHPWVQAALLWFAAQSGPLPDHPGTAPFAGWQAMLHQSGAWHPKGGSGMLTQALARFIEAHGGEVRTGQEVHRIIVKNGTAEGVKLADGTEISAKAVLSNAHVKTTMLKMLEEDDLESGLRNKIRNINVGNGFGMAIRCAVEELPQYEAAPNDYSIHNGMQLLAPSTTYMQRAIGDYQRGEPPEKPAVLAMTFSAIDQNVAPSGGHTLYAWAQWHPYHLSNGEAWSDIRLREAEKIYNVICGYTPNMRGKLIDWYIQTPEDIERKHGMINGNVMHVEMTLDQMFMFRPIPELSSYQTPIKRLYLASASCHPGGGVFGAAGRSAAGIIRKDLEGLVRRLFQK